MRSQKLHLKLTAVRTMAGVLTSSSPVIRRLRFRAMGSRPSEAMATLLCAKTGRQALFGSATHGSRHWSHRDQNRASQLSISASEFISREAVTVVGAFNSSEKYGPATRKSMKARTGIPSTKYRLFPEPGGLGGARLALFQPARQRQRFQSRQLSFRVCGGC